MSQLKEAHAHQAPGETPYAWRIAEALHALTVDALPPATQLKTRHCLIDYLAAVWNAQGHPLAADYVELAASLAGGEGHGGTATVIGDGRALPPFWAAFANAAQGHVTEVDDGHRQSIMHIGTVVAPVVLALAEERGLDNGTLLAALVCGYDLAIRAGECFGPEHYGLFHTTATAGAFGAAAAAARAMNLSTEQTAWAIGHAGTQAAGLWQFLQDKAVSAKPFHPARAAQNGIMAARLAERNIPAASAIFEGTQGFCAVAAPAPQYHRLTDGLGTHFKIDEVNFKGYPTCGQTHSMLDALGAIIAEHGVKDTDVVSVRARVYNRAVDVAGIREPDTLEQAKFSNPFCMAFLLRHGALTFTNFTEQALEDAAVRDLAARVELVVDEEMNAGFPAARPCEVSVRLTDGRTLRAANRFRRGDPENPMDTPAMEDKFEQLTAHVLPATQRKHIVEWCLHADNEQLLPRHIFTRKAETKE